VSLQTANGFSAAGGEHVAVANTTSMLARDQAEGAKWGA
jgi:hypothetical protein